MVLPDETKVTDLSGNGSTTNEENIIPICTTPKIAIVKPMTFKLEKTDVLT
jgi:hypothetical protein